MAPRMIVGRGFSFGRRIIPTARLPTTLAVSSRLMRKVTCVVDETGHRGQHPMRRHYSGEEIGHRPCNASLTISSTTKSIDERRVFRRSPIGPRSSSTVTDYCDDAREGQRQPTSPPLPPSSRPQLSELSRFDEEEKGEGDGRRPNHAPKTTNRWTERYLNSFADRIQRNVRVVIRQVGGGDDGSSDSVVQSSGGFLRRWNDAYRREREIHHRQVIMHQRNDPTRTHRTKTTMEDDWDDALRSIGLPSLSTTTAIEAMNIPLIPPRENNVSADDGDNELSSKIDFTTVTPLFGLAVDDDTCVRDWEGILMRDSESVVELNPAVDAVEIMDFDDDTVQCGKQLHVQSSNPTTNDDDDSSSSSSSNEHVYHDSILQAVALLRVTNPNDWIKFDSCRSLHFVGADIENAASETQSALDASAKQQGVLNGLDPDEYDWAKNDDSNDASSMLRGFLQEVVDRKHATTTLEANLCLAQLATSTVMEADAILEGCLRIYNEMRIVTDSGQSGCQPDSTTYRLLILSFNRRLMAHGQAIKLCRAMTADETASILTPEAFMEGIKACKAKMDLITANAMMDCALTKDLVQPSVGSCIAFVDMMKMQQLRDEAIAFFHRVHQARILSLEAEDKLLLSLCGWPNRTRRGDYVDLASFLRNILSIVESRTRMAFPLWSKLIEEIYKVAKVDQSQMPIVAEALSLLLKADPRRSPGRKLMWIGLEASDVLGDAVFAAELLRQVAQNRRLPRSTATPDGKGTYNAEFNPSTSIPHQAVKIGLEICLKQGDTESAEAISKVLDQLNDAYPLAAQKELLSMILLCHAKAGDADAAKIVLQKMIAKGMSPG
jgi:hypothetical protein